MNTEKFKNYSLPVNIEEYKIELLKDFKAHPSFRNLANSILYFNSLSIEEWVKGIKGKNFRIYETANRVNNTPVVYDIEDVKKEEWKWHFFEPNIDEPYIFFEKREYESFDEVKKKNPGFYYVFNRNFFKKVDEVLMGAFRDFEMDEQNKTVYTKRLSKDHVLKLACNYEKYISSSGINEYVFPTVSLLFNGNEYHFFTVTDVREMFFLSGTSFLFFYIESNDLIFNEANQLVGTTRKYNEPQVYHNAESNKYIVTNSYKKLPYYNKYIYLILELHIHYFRVFENWIINSIIKSS